MPANGRWDLIRRLKVKPRPWPLRCPQLPDIFKQAPVKNLVQAQEMRDLRGI